MQGTQETRERTERTQRTQETQEHTQGTQETLERMLGSTRNLTIDKLITQNCELIKKCDTLNDKIDNIEKIIVTFIENKKEEISEAFVTVILITKPFV
jgi:hypothetical protein